MTAARQQGVHPVHQLSLVVLSMVVGLSIGVLKNSNWESVRENIKLAFLNQYHARSGHIEGSRSFYVATSDKNLLIEMLLKKPNVEKVERTFMDRVLIVTISRDISNTFNVLRHHQLVNAITTIPLFCH